MISIDIFESLESEFCPHCDSPSECQVDEEMEKAASTPSARPESNGLDWTQSTLPPGSSSTSSRPKVNPEKEKTHHAEATTTATGEGAALGTIPNRKDLSKISSINFSQRCDHLFFAVMRVPYVILAAQLQLLRTFKSYSSAKLFPSSAVMPWIGEAKKQREFCGASKSCRVEATNRC